MTPAARVQSAIELLDAIIIAARDGGAAADTLAARFFRERRYAGSKDRRAIRDLAWQAIRRCAERPESGRAALLRLAADDPPLARLFDGSAHGPAPIDPGRDRPAAAGIVPGWIAPLLVAPLLGDETAQAALLARAPLDLRVNRIRGDAAAVHAHFPQAMADPAFPDLLRLPTGEEVEESAAWRAGLIDIQDAGSQHIAALCAPAPGALVVDLCAGAGGKALALAAAMGNRGRIVACDISRDRLAALAPRAARLGADIISTRLLNPQAEQAALGDLAGKADLVLVDAPCSGTGTWRRNPESRWRLTPARLARLEAEQARLLDVAAALLRPGGALVYAVCSLIAREGAGQIDACLARTPGLAPDVDAERGAPALRHGPGWLLLPHIHGCDGFFVARLLKAERF